MEMQWPGIFDNATLLRLIHISFSPKRINSLVPLNVYTVDEPLTERQLRP